MASQDSDITLYTTQTPNGIKISITLEELGVKKSKEGDQSHGPSIRKERSASILTPFTRTLLDEEVRIGQYFCCIPYKTHKIEISKDTQKEPWFRAINPNGRIPALTDTFSDGKPINLFESGSIMQYLVERYDSEYKISFPKGSREWYEMNNWLFFQNAGVGPMQGQANHFTRYAPEHIEYGVNRYQNETRRLYGVLDEHLAADDKKYLVGNKCTIADISHYGWVAAAGWAGINIDDFPALKAWEERMTARPGVEKGRHVPDPHTIKELLKDPAKMEELAAKSRAWVQAGMKQDAEKSSGK